MLNARLKANKKRCPTHLFQAGVTNGMQHQAGKWFLLPLFALLEVVAQPSTAYPRATHLTLHKSQSSDSGRLGFGIAAPSAAAAFPAGNNPRWVYFLFL